MKTLKGYFKDFFGMDLPREFLYQGQDKLHGYSHVNTPEPDLTKACMVANDIAVNHDLLPIHTEILESMFMAFPDGYYMMGLHECGFSNRWFYYVSVDHWRRIFMRIPYGPTNNLEGGSNVYGKVSHKYLQEYLKFMRRLQGKVECLQVMEDPHCCRYRITMPDGQEFEYQGDSFRDRLLDKPDFEGAFPELWPLLESKEEEGGREADPEYRQLKLP